VGAVPGMLIESDLMRPERESSAHGRVFSANAASRLQRRCSLRIGVVICNRAWVAPRAVLVLTKLVRSMGRDELPQPLALLNALGGFSVFHPRSEEILLGYRTPWRRKTYFRHKKQKADPGGFRRALLLPWADRPQVRPQAGHAELGL